MTMRSTVIAPDDIRGRGGGGNGKVTRHSRTPTLETLHGVCPKGDLCTRSGSQWVCLHP